MRICGNEDAEKSVRTGDGRDEVDVGVEKCERCEDQYEGWKRTIDKERRPKPRLRIKCNLHLNFRLSFETETEN